MARDGTPPRTVGVFSMGEVLGDALYKMVFLRGLRTAFPDARISWLTVLETAYARELRPVAGPPLLDEVIEGCGLEPTPRGLLRAPPSGLGPYDLLIDTQSMLMRAAILWCIPHGRFLSAATLRRGLAGARVGPHVLDRLFALLELGAGRPVPQDRSLLDLPPALHAAAEAALPGAAPRIAIAPGAGGKTKIWPLERFIALARAQAARGRQPVFMLGPEEAAWRERIAAEVPGAV